LRARTSTAPPRSPHASPASGGHRRGRDGKPPRSVAIVHDYLNQTGGAERVVLALSGMWPRAPVYTSIYRPASTFPEFQALDVRTSPLDVLPIDRRFRALLHLYPAAFRSLGVLDYDLVISSSSGWAHGARTREHTTHIVYWHTPARWLYSPEQYLPARPLQRKAMEIALRPLRPWDQRAARRADGFIANSENVRARVRVAYGRDAEVVHPPVEIERFTPRPRGDRLLLVSRLLPYKRVELAVEAANRTGLALDIVGSGPCAAQLHELAGPTVRLHGPLDDASVAELLESCRALVQPGEEDFGIAPVEANAAGKPVVAFAGGGALETVRPGLTGELFPVSTVEALVGALERVDRLTTSPEQLASAARRFSTEAFCRQMSAAVQRIEERRIDAAVRDGDFAALSDKDA
jgi:glycosyltransferase involved in cell wall biosynthesis